MQVKDLQLKRALRSVLIALMIGVAGLGNSYAERVEPETAQRVAATFLRNNGVRSNQLTNVSERAGFSNLYIFNGEPGFVIMSADDKFTPILGYSLTGNFAVEDMPADVRWWLDGYNMDIQYVIDHNAVLSSNVVQSWQDLKSGLSEAGRSVSVVSEMLETRWHQFFPYNKQCPDNTVTGCVATAMAQIMKKWNYPEQGQGSYTNTNNPNQTVNFGETTYDWSNMDNVYSANGNGTVHDDAVATLMFHCGVSVNTVYGDESEAFMNVVDDALIAYFRYSDDAEYKQRNSVANYDTWISMMKEDLDNGWPILYGGDEADGGGHCFVCDGYDSNDRFHFNFGWQNTDFNGYYLISEIVYNQTQDAVFGIHPETTSGCSAPTNLTASVNGSDITLTWTAAEGVDSYRIYRNGVMIESDATGSSYIDSSLEIGVYQYYLRSNCTGGGISDNSNIVSIMVEFQGSMTIAVGDLRYSLNFQTMTAQVNGGHPTGNLVIPSSVTYSNTNTTFRVVSIRNEAFKNEVEITALTIPNSVILIGSSAFYGCSGLTSLTIGNSVTSIGGCAFYGCSGLTSLTIGNSVTSIGGSAFYGCSGLTSLTIGNSVTSIEGNAFYGCSGLETIVVGIGNPIYDSRENCNAIVKTSTNELVIGFKNTVIPNSITSIGNRAFYNCSGLTILTIPNSVTSIGDWAFYGCSGLITVNWNAVNVTSYPTNTNSSHPFSNCTCLTTVVFGDQVQTIPAHAFYDCSSITDLTIGNSVTSIGNRAFHNCSGLTTLTISNSVTSIGIAAFSGCSGLTTLTIPNSITSIGNRAFYNCSGLTILTIPNSVTSIGDWAFYGCSGLTTVYWNAENVTSYPTTSYNPFSNCTNLTTIVFGDQVQTIPAYAFYNYSSINDLTSINNLTLGNSVTTIGNYAFYNCSGLTGSLTIPNSVTTIGNYAFYNCSGITGLTIGNSVTSIGDWAFRDCSGLTTVYWNAENVTSYPTTGFNSFNPFSNCSSLTTVVFGDQVQTIPATAFYNCISINNLTIGNSVTSIGYEVFYNCSGLTGSLTIPNSVTTIGNYAFYNCSGITGLTIGNSVTTLGNYAFRGCSGLTGTLTIPNSVTSIGDYAFYGCSGLTTLTIPNSVTSIGNYAFRNCSGLTSLTIGNSVTTIGGYAFSGCSGLTGTLTIPNSVTTIGGYAFSGRSGLTTVHWNAVNVSSYPSSSSNPFRNCTNLTTVVFGEQVQTIPNDAFYGFSGLTGSLTIPNSVTSIGYDAFSGCSGLTTVHWNAVNVSSYPPSNSNPFRNCTNLTTVVLGEQVQTIPNGAFYGCSGLTGTLTIPNSVTSIGSYAFSGCSGLESVHYTGDIAQWCNIEFASSSSNPLYYAHNLYINDELVTNLEIPESVTEIKNYAFYGCSGLTSLTIPNSVTTIGGYAFSGCSGLTTVHWNAVNASSYPSSSNSNPFRNCTNLTTVVFGEQVQTIPNYAFSGCSGLTGSLTIPNSVTSIGYYAFSSCSGLESVHYTGDIAQWCNIEFASLSNPLYYAHNLYINDELVTNLEIPKSVTEIKKYAFDGCSGLTGSLTIPNSVTSIGNYAFRNCSGLTGTLTIPNSVTTIGSNAFSNCTGITAIRMHCPVPPTINQYTFSNFDKSIPVFVACGTQEAYLVADYWSEFTSINESPYDLVITQNDPYGGEISVVHYADCEDGQCVIYAESNLGYSFAGWYVDDELLTGLAQYDFSMVNDITMEARFSRNANHSIANGATNTWSDPNTWDSGVVPSSTSTVAIYKNIIVDVEAEVEQMGIYDDGSITISQDVTLTVTDTLGSDNVASIVIEDGGQLIHSNDGAMATVKKTIQPYTNDNDGWNLLAYPLTGNGTVASIGNMLNNEYDLYAYDEPTQYWINQKEESNGFTALEAGKGYLYANIGQAQNYTTDYFPFYTYYKYNISENLFRAVELMEAGLGTGSLNGLSWYAINAPGYEQSNISIWMANVSDEELTANSHLTSGMTLVYTGNMTPAIGWNEFVFNENTFAWDGTSNLLISVQRNNGAYNSSVLWQSHEASFTAMSYNYTDNVAYDATTATYSMYTSTSRPNIIFNGITDIRIGDVQYNPITLTFSGELENGTAEVIVPLSYTETAGTLKGFNLVGNPYVHNVTSYGSTNVAEGCFRLNETKDNLIVSEVSETLPLKPAEGFFVKATGENASIIFNPGRLRGETKRKGFVNLELREGGKLIDRLIVKREGDPLEKLTLKENGTRLFATQNKQEIAIVPCEGNEQPINFKAAKNGSYMITATLDNMVVDYLHLIDNLTGNDVDLLQTPEYTFSARTTDYASRFRLVFSVGGDEEDDDAPFAFINNGNIIIVGAEDGAILQIMDVLGHVIHSGDAMNRISTSGMAKGVYVLRLINGDDVRVQKIVIR